MGAALFSVRKIGMLSIGKDTKKMKQYANSMWSNSAEFYVLLSVWGVWPDVSVCDRMIKYVKLEGVAVVKREKCINFARRNTAHVA